MHRMISLVSRAIYVTVWRKRKNAYSRINNLRTLLHLSGTVTLLFSIYCALFGKNMGGGG